MEQKVVIIITNGKNNPEKATVAFAMANGALIMEAKPIIILQDEAVYLATKGYTDDIAVDGFDPLEKLMSNVLAEGNRIMVCAPCAKKRGIAPEDLREGFFIGGAAKAMEEILSATQAISY